MDIADLARARAWVQSLEDERGYVQGAGWVHALADEVELLQSTLATAQDGERTAVAERDAALAGMQEIYNSVVAMLREARHVADNHPDPAAAGAALRILGEAG